MDLNELKHRELERILHAEETAEKNIKKTKRESIIAFVLTIVLLAIVFYPILLILTDNQINSILSGDASRTTIFAVRNSVTDSFLFSKGENYLNRKFEDYKAEKIPYYELLDVIERFRDYDNGSVFGEFVEDMKVSGEALADSRNNYYEGLQAYEEESYIVAMDCFQHVIPDDSYYETAQEYIKEIHWAYKRCVLEQSVSDLEENKSKEAKELLLTATSYLEDEDLQKCYQMLEDGENPLIYLSWKEINDNPEAFSKDPAHSNAICEEVRIIRGGEGLYYLCMGFHIEADGCYYYYQVTPTRFKEVENKDVTDFVQKNSDIRQEILVLTEEEKNSTTVCMNHIYESMMKLQKAGKKDKKKAEKKISEDLKKQKASNKENDRKKDLEIKRKEAGKKLIFVPFILLLVEVFFIYIAIKMLIHAISSIFK